MKYLFFASLFSLKSTNKSSSQNAESFIEWRLDNIEVEWKVIKRMMTDYRENTEAVESRLKHAMTELKEKQADFEQEMLIIQKQKSFIKENIQNSKQATQDAYI